MNREEAKNLFRKDKDSYGKPKGVMGKINLIYDDFESQIELLQDKIREQKETITTMTNVLKFCSRNDVGAFYQQQTAREMVVNQKQIIWDRYNSDGSTAQHYRKWIHDCAESREKGSGNQALKELDEYEKSLKIQ